MSKAQFSNWSPSVSVAPDTDMVVLRDLPPAQKQRTWAGIKAQDPLLAAGMSGDPIVQHLLATFDAVLVLPADDVKRFGG